MLRLLSPRLWIAAALAALLAFTHFTAYRSGHAHVRADWDKAIAVQVADALRAEQVNRAREQALRIANERVTRDYVQEKSRLAAARVAADKRLRKFESALAGAAGTDPAADAGNYGDPRSEIIAGCVRQLAILDEATQRLASQTTALQRYIGEVLLKPGDAP